MSGLCVFAHACSCVYLSVLAGMCVCMHVVCMWVFACMCVCMNVSCMYVCHVYVCLHVRVSCVFAHAHVRVCVCVCVCVCVEGPSLCVSFLSFHIWSLT